MEQREYIKIEIISLRARQKAVNCILSGQIGNYRKGDQLRHEAILLEFQIDALEKEIL